MALAHTGQVIPFPSHAAAVNRASARARLEARTVFRRREAEGSLPAGETAVLSADMDRDVAAGRVVIQATDADVERDFAKVLETCFSQTPSVFIRTNDALHIASAIVAGETRIS